MRKTKFASRRTARISRLRQISSQRHIARSVAPSAASSLDFQRRSTHASPQRSLLSRRCVIAKTLLLHLSQPPIGSERSAFTMGARAERTKSSAGRWPRRSFEQYTHSQRRRAMFSASMADDGINVDIRQISVKCRQSALKCQPLAASPRHAQAARRRADRFSSPHFVKRLVYPGESDAFRRATPSPGWPLDGGGASNMSHFYVARQSNYQPHVGAAIEIDDCDEMQSADIFCRRAAQLFHAAIPTTYRSATHLYIIVLLIFIKWASPASTQDTLWGAIFRADGDIGVCQK